MNAAGIVLRNGLLIDGSGPAPLGCVDVRIAEGLIQDVGSSVATAPGAVEIELDGRAVMPGLIDCHVHANILEDDLRQLSDVPASLTAIRAARVLFDMLQRGFTSVRDAGGADWGLKAAIEQGHAAGPRLFIAGHALSQTGGHGDYRRRTESDPEPCSCATALRSIARVADGEDEVRRAVRDELRQGADQIKIMASSGLSGFHEKRSAREYSPGEIRAAVEEAEARGSYVMAHAYTVDAVEQALDCGVRTIEHGNLIDARIAAKIADKGAFLVPTLVTYCVPASGPGAAPDEKTARMFEDMLRAGQEAVRLCREAGVEIGFGTDLFGSLHSEQGREFLLRREVQPAHEIIDSATRVNARILQREGRLGVIAPGAVADVIAVDGNPLDDIALLADGSAVSLVIKDGRIFKNKTRKDGAGTMNSHFQGVQRHDC